MRELDPDDMGEGSLDETDGRWAVAGEVAVCRLPLNNVGECASHSAAAQAHADTKVAITGMWRH